MLPGTLLVLCAMSGEPERQREHTRAGAVVRRKRDVSRKRIARKRKLPLQLRALLQAKALNDARAYYERRRRNAVLLSKAKHPRALLRASGCSSHDAADDLLHDAGVHEQTPSENLPVTAPNPNPNSPNPTSPVPYSELGEDDDAPAVRHTTYASAAAARKPEGGAGAASGSRNTQQQEMEALRAELAELKALVQNTNGQASAQQGAAAPPSTVRVTPKDVHLEKFSGNRDACAHVITEDQFLPLLEWLQACEFTLVTSRLPSDLHVPVLVSHLTGAAKRAFLRRWGTLDASVMHAWSLKDAKIAIASLVPNHKVQFTKLAFDMQFSAHSLANDLQKFALYMQHGELPADNSRYVFDRLQEKMQRAVRDIFSTASGLYNKPFVFKPTFAEIMRDAIDIVSTLQVNGKLVSKRGRDETDSNQETRPLKKGNKRLQVPRGAQPPRQRGNSSKRREFMELARRFNRCFGCGKHVEGAQIASHREPSSRNPQEFSKRMGQVKRLVDAGREAEVNVFPPPRAGNPRPPGGANA